jgi:hypothetical protein
MAGRPDTGKTLTGLQEKKPLLTRDKQSIQALTNTLAE